MPLPKLPAIPSSKSLQTRPIANEKYFNLEDFKDVIELFQDDPEHADPKDVSRYCEYLIRSGFNSNATLEKWLSKADLDYVDKNNNNLLVISILSNNFRPIDILLELKCDRTVKNTTHNLCADDLLASPKCHRTIKEIFKKHSNKC